MAFDSRLAEFFDLSGLGGSAFEPKLEPVVGFMDRDPERVQFGNVAGSRYYADDPDTGLEYYLPVKVIYPENNKPGARLVEYYLPHPVFSITNRKMVVETTLTERGGIATEIISLQGWRIRIQGKMVSQTNEVPEEQMTQLADIFQVGRSLSIRNPIIDIFLMRHRAGNDKVTVRSINIPEVVGVKSVRPYELELVSDDVFNLELIK